MLLPAGAFKEVDIPIAIAQLASEVADYLASNFCGMRRDDLLDPYVTKAVQAAEANLALKRASRKPMPMPAIQEHFPATKRPGASRKRDRALRVRPRAAKLCMAFRFSAQSSVHAGETMLVLGAAGGVGMAAIDVAKALKARVIAAASSAEKRDLCSRRGADQTLDYSVAQWRTQLTALTNNRGIDVVYDPVGGSYSEIAFRCVALGGAGWPSSRGRLCIRRDPEVPFKSSSSEEEFHCGCGLRWSRPREPGSGPSAGFRASLVGDSWEIHPEANPSNPLGEAGAVLQRLLDRGKRRKTGNQN